MALTLQQTTALKSTTSTTATVTPNAWAGSSIATGDVLVVELVIGGSTGQAVTTIPTGWTAISNGTTAKEWKLFARIADGTASDTPGAFSWVTNNGSTVISRSFRGAATASTGIHEYSVTTTQTNTATPTSNSITTTIDGCFIATAFQDNGTATSTAGTGNTLDASGATSGRSTGFQHQTTNQATAGAITEGFTFSVASNTSSLIYAIAPAAVVSAVVNIMAQAKLLGIV